MIFKQLALAIAALLFALVAHAATPTQPNILFVLCDDLGWGDLGTFYQNSRASGLPRERTPQLDKLAAEGAKLTNHYSAAPVCAPSRASIFLGVSQGHANIRNNQFDKALENNHTLATVLGTAGYATVAIGKWGLQGRTKQENHPADWPGYPTKRGFDSFFGYVRHSDGHEHYPKEGVYRGKKEVWQNDANIASKLDKCYTADLWTAWAKQWIVQHEKAHPDQPFFMYLGYDTPHAVTELPTQAYPAGGGLTGGLQWLGKPGHMITTASGTPDSWVHPDYLAATYDDDNDPSTPEVAWPNVNQRYATAVRRIDDAVGDLKQLLRDLKIDSNTLVIFSSDNGPSIESYLKDEPLRADFFDSFGPFDGIKRDCWEGGVRVPTLACWPGHIAAGTVLDQPSISYDWLPTFADAAGVPAPARTDGVSILPDLTGSGGQRHPESLYVEYFHGGKTPDYADFAPAHRGRQRGQMQVVRMGDYVGVRYDVKSQDDPFEIYNVTKDPKQMYNLAPEKQDLEKRMKSKVLQVRRPNDSAERPYDNELVPALSDRPVEPGIEWSVYEGVFPWVPDFETLQACRQGLAKQMDLTPLTRTDDIGLFFNGLINVPEDGTYTFALSADTGALLRIHDATVIDADFGYEAGKESEGSIQLKAGLHPIRLYYYARKTKNSPSLDLKWRGPGFDSQPVPARALCHSTS